MILCETHSPGYAMLMRPDKAETAVHDCHYRGDRLCACVEDICPRTLSVLRSDHLTIRPVALKGFASWAIDP